MNLPESINHIDSVYFIGYFNIELNEVGGPCPGRIRAGSTYCLQIKGFEVNNERLKLVPSERLALILFWYPRRLCKLVRRCRRPARDVLVSFVSQQSEAAPSDQDLFA
jgi:hypothetical protein